MNKELSPEQNSLIEGLIEKHSTPLGSKHDYATEIDYKAAMEELVTILSPEWVSVKDYLPSKSGAYMIFGCYANGCPRSVFEADYIHKNRRFRTDIGAKEVTHWMPLPSPPKQ